MERVLAVLILVGCAFAPSALAACVACRTLECSYVHNCGGCMGWTCHGDDAIDADIPSAEPILTVVESKIEVQKPEKH